MRLLFPDTRLMFENDFQSVAYVPFFLDAPGQYLDGPSQYLRERALLEWLPEDALPVLASSSLSGSLSYPTIASLRTMGEKLKNFLEWCASKQIDWRSAEYTAHVISGYQAQMTTGEWSQTGRPLDGKTINQRASEATLFLAWTSQAGVRNPSAPPFAVPRRRKKASKKEGGSGRGKVAEIDSRAGSVSMDPPLFWLPTQQEVGCWLRNVYSVKGKVKGLCCELILETGIRNRECVEWRADLLPIDRKDWIVRGDKVHVLIRAGTKGKRAQPSDIDGPARWVKLPISFAERLHSYRLEERPSQHARWVRAAKTPDEKSRRRRMGLPPQLFLGEGSNRPFGTRMLHRAWTETPGCPKGWRPHLGRHFCAGQKLIDITLEKIKAAGVDLGKLNADWLTGSANNDITLVIRPMLGHISDETTNGYLGWLRSWFEAQTGQGPLRWHDYLEKGCSGDA